MGEKRVVGRGPRQAAAVLAGVQRRPACLPAACQLLPSPGHSAFSPGRPRLRRSACLATTAAPMASTLARTATSGGTNTACRSGPLTRARAAAARSGRPTRRLRQRQRRRRKRHRQERGKEEHQQEQHWEQQTKQQQQLRQMPCPTPNLPQRQVHRQEQEQAQRQQRQRRMRGQQRRQQRRRGQPSAAVAAPPLCLMRPAPNASPRSSPM